MGKGPQKKTGKGGSVDWINGELAKLIDRVSQPRMRLHWTRLESRSARVGPLSDGSPYLILGLAKEQGYRARSAFKLIQLNKKYDFLSSARCVIDLCAAPGGWLQVAAKNMPPNSIIIGVDLVPIKPIPRCITLVDDITTEKCRRDIRAEVKDWKADVVLHDGAPNVGSAWVQDAFTQVELVLASLKLATEFLTAGGTFVTKVFRSKDYNSLIWVFNQLFNKVEATKPPSSRNVSAEIFVVCSGYLAPSKIDPKLLNAKHVFSDIDITTSTGVNPLSAVAALGQDGKISSKDTLTPTSLNVFQPDKKRRNRDGYADGDMTLHKECGVSEFIRSVDPIGVLGLVNEMKWRTDEDKKLYKHPLTTFEIKALVQDLKVLGKKDFKTLLKYRLAVREDYGLESKGGDGQGENEGPDATDEVEVEPIDEDEQIAQELSRLSAEEQLRRKREKRRANEKKAREIQRMQLNMVTPMDIGLERQDGVDDADVFDLGEVEGNEKAGRSGVQGRTLGEDVLEDDEGDEEDQGINAARAKLLRMAEQSAVLMDEDDEDDEDLDEQEIKMRRLERSLDTAYDMYHQHKMERDAKHKAKEERRKRDAKEGGEWHGIQAKGSDDEDDGDDDDEFDPAPQPSSDEDDSEDDPEDEDMEVEEALVPTTKNNKPKAKALLTKLQPVVSEEKKTVEKSRAAQMWFDQPVFKGMPELDKLLNGGDNEDSDAEDQVSVEASDDEDGETWNGLDSDREDQEEDDEVEVDSEEDEYSDDDFTGARETHFEDSDMEEEADLKAQEEAEELKRQRIEGEFLKIGLTTAEAMTLAQQLVNREKTKTQLIDEGFNRYTSNLGGDGLPSWFLDDEQRHFRNNIPITKEAVVALREKMRELNARPIKKIAEAKARKKMRAIRRAEKMRAKAQGINDDDENGLTEKEKAASIAKVLSKAKSSGKPTKKREIKVVVAKGANRGIKGRPKGVKGRYKMVDPRDRKEARALKRIAKRDKKGGGRRKKNK
ncbi:BQ2448_3636 [Microbotryum intermedium]|uniref:BQ2448_3636 protein n=1 Tax=Microbotryum intermedium TaxID=269621 RepID=A0A238FG69_9BASI|nr:BQ2448_3636 [Microbotryum intermedium]